MRLASSDDSAGAFRERDFGGRTCINLLQLTLINVWPPISGHGQTVEPRAAFPPGL